MDIRTYEDLRKFCKQNPGQAIIVSCSVGLAWELQIYSGATQVNINDLTNNHPNLPLVAIVFQADNVQLALCDDRGYADYDHTIVRDYNDQILADPILSDHVKRCFSTLIGIERRDLFDERQK